LADSFHQISRWRVTEKAFDFNSDLSPCPLGGNRLFSKQIDNSKGFRAWRDTQPLLFGSNDPAVSLGCCSACMIPSLLNKRVLTTWAVEAMERETTAGRRSSSIVPLASVVPYPNTIP
jgi:hypothetical protein